MKLRGEIRPRTVTFRGYDEYTFSGERLKEGTRKFSPEDELGIDEEAMPGRGKPRRLPTQELKLDDAGAARTKFVKLPKIDTPKSLHAELEYRDPNGEVQTAATDIPLAPSKRAVGLKPDSWAASAEALRSASSCSILPATLLPTARSPWISTSAKPTRTAGGSPAGSTPTRT